MNTRRTKPPIVVIDAEFSLVTLPSGSGCDVKTVVLNHIPLGGGPTRPPRVIDLSVLQALVDSGDAVFLYGSQPQRVVGRVTRANAMLEKRGFAARRTDHAALERACLELGKGNVDSAAAWLDRTPAFRSV